MKKKALVPYFVGLSPLKYAKLYIFFILILFVWFKWAEHQNYSIEQVNELLSLVYIPISIGFILIPILYAINFIYHRGNLNRSSAFATLALKNNLDYKEYSGLIISDIKDIVSEYPFFTTFFGVEKLSRDYIIQKKDKPNFYMFDYAYPISSRSAKYTFHKTIFIIDFTDLKLPTFQIKPSGLFDFILRRNLKSMLPKTYSERLKGYCFWFEDKESSASDITKIIPSELLPIIKENKGLVIECFSSHLVINFNNCKIPSFNLTEFFDLGVSVKNAYLNQS